MALKITDLCTNCGKCVDECPNDAIEELDDICVIDPNLCQECKGVYPTPRCAELCPVNCCVPLEN